MQICVNLWHIFIKTTCHIYSLFVGHAPGAHDIKDWTLTSSGAQESIVNLPLEHGETIYALVLCRNKAGLESMATSGAVIMVTKPPDVSNAQLEIGEPTLLKSLIVAICRSVHTFDMQSLLYVKQNTSKKKGECILLFPQ